MRETSIPVIDLSELPDEPRSLDLLDKACREWGFFQIVNHGIDDTECQGVLDQMTQFFGQPHEQKQRIVRTSENAWGFYDQELTKNVRDWKEIFDVGPAESRGPLAGAVPQWPEGLLQFRETTERHAESCERISRRLLASIAINLKVSPGILANAFAPVHSSYLRLNYYPVYDNPPVPTASTGPQHGEFGVSHHTDAGALTVLMQSAVAGLQLRYGEQWHLIEPLDGALIINIGDVVQVWSNDRYKAPLHRVIVNRALQRFSAAFFFNPSYDANYAPLPSVCDDTDPPRYQSINWGEFRAGRTAGDYADHGEEIQITHFRTPARQRS